MRLARDSVRVCCRTFCFCCFVSILAISECETLIILASLLRCVHILMANRVSLWFISSSFVLFDLLGTNLFWYNGSVYFEDAEPLLKTPWTTPLFKQSRSHRAHGTLGSFSLESLAPSSEWKSQLSCDSLQSEIWPPLYFNEVHLQSSTTAPVCQPSRATLQDEHQKIFLAAEDD